LLSASVAVLITAGVASAMTPDEALALAKKTGRPILAVAGSKT
jgi:hypothetical protein